MAAEYLDICVSVGVRRVCGVGIAGDGGAECLVVHRGGVGGRRSMTDCNVLSAVDD